MEPESAIIDGADRFDAAKPLTKVPARAVGPLVPALAPLTWAVAADSAGAALAASALPCDPVAAPDMPPDGEYPPDEPPEEPPDVEGACRPYEPPTIEPPTIPGAGVE